MSIQNAYRTKNPAHIAFMNIPGHGHVNPGLGLVSALIERGHRVTYAVPKSFAPQVVEAGAEHVGYASLLPTGEKGDEWTDDMVEASNMFLDEAIQVVPQLDAAYEGDRPDLVVHDIGAQHAPVLAENWGVPSVSMSPTHLPFEGFEDVFGIDEQAPGMAEFRDRFRAFLDSHGSALTYESMITPSRSLATIPRSFQYYADRVQGDVTFVGPMLTERAFQGDWQPPQDRRVLLVSLGSAYTNQPEFFRNCVRAFADSGWHVVLVVGKHVDPDEIEPVPSTVEVHRWVPQLRILAHADAFITHSGMGGTMEAMYCGVPQIGVGWVSEQFANAARVEELGLGKHVPLPEATPEALREALEYVSSDVDVQRRVAAMREEILASGGIRTAVEVLESELAS